MIDGSALLRLLQSSSAAEIARALISDTAPGTGSPQTPPMRAAGAGNGGTASGTISAKVEGNPFSAAPATTPAPSPEGRTAGLSLGVPTDALPAPPGAQAAPRAGAPAQGEMDRAKASLSPHAPLGRTSAPSEQGSAKAPARSPTGAGILGQAPGHLAPGAAASGARTVDGAELPAAQTLAGQSLSGGERAVTGLERLGLAPPATLRAGPPADAQDTGVTRSQNMPGSPGAGPSAAGSPGAQVSPQMAPYGPLITQRAAQPPVPGVAQPPAPAQGLSPSPTAPSVVTWETAAAPTGTAGRAETALPGSMAPAVSQAPIARAPAPIAPALLGPAPSSQTDLPSTSLSGSAPVGASNTELSRPTPSVPMTGAEPGSAALRTNSPPEAGTTRTAGPAGAGIPAGLPNATETLPAKLLPEALAALTATAAIAAPEARSIGTLVIYNAAMLPGWPYRSALATDPFPASARGVALEGAATALAGLSPQEQAEYLARIGAPFLKLARLREILIKVAPEKAKQLEGLLIALLATLDTVLEGVRLSLELSQRLDLLEAARSPATPTRHSEDDRRRFTL